LIRHKLPSRMGCRAIFFIAIRRKTLSGYGCRMSLEGTKGMRNHPNKFSLIFSEIKTSQIKQIFLTFASKQIVLTSFCDSCSFAFSVSISNQ
jgi:hypothetical protein